MTQQPASFVHGTADAGGEIAQLRYVLALVEELAGRPSAPAVDPELDEAARVSAAYGAAEPIVQRRFETLAAHTARWAAAGVAALVALRERDRPIQPAAARLAEELVQALERLRAVVSA